MSLLKSSSIFKRASVSLRPHTVPAKRLASGGTVHDDDPAILEVEKNRNLSNQQHRTSTTQEEHAPGWNEYLASSSEAHIKADRYGQDGPPTIDLTERTIKHLKNRYQGNRFLGSSREEASYEREEVEGPLKTSFAGNTDNVIHDDSQMQDKVAPSEEAVKANRGNP